MSIPRLAVIVPAYDEESRLGPTLDRLCAYFETQSYSWIIVTVSDGSRDRTPQIVMEKASGNNHLRLIHYTPNRGKGNAVRVGMLEVEAEYLLFSDADLAAPIEEIEKLWPSVEAGADVAIGSRPLKESRLEIRQPWHRELLGRAFNVAVQTLAVKGIQDTQCGFKLFTNKAAKEIFSRCKLDGFGFDFESLMIARDLGYRIDEVPIRWAHQEGSKVVLMRDGPRMLRDLVKLRLMGKRNRLTLRRDK